MFKGDHDHAAAGSSVALNQDGTIIAVGMYMYRTMRPEVEHYSDDTQKSDEALLISESKHITALRGLVIKCISHRYDSCTRDC